MSGSALSRGLESRHFRQLSAYNLVLSRGRCRPESIVHFFVESQIKPKDIHARFTENIELALLDVALDESSDLILADTTDT